MIVTYKTAQEVRAYLGAAVDKFTDKELQVLIDYFDYEEVDCELTKELFEGWNKAKTPSEACFKIMTNKKFEELQKGFKYQRRGEVFKEDGSYNEEVEESFCTELGRKHHVAWDDEICLYKKI